MVKKELITKRHNVDPLMNYKLNELHGVIVVSECQNEVERKRVDDDEFI